MRKLVVAMLAACLLVPFASRAHAAPCANCLLLGSDSGAGFHDPGSFYLRAAGTAVEYKGERQGPRILHYRLVADISYVQRGAALFGGGKVQIFEMGADSPLYELEVDAVAAAPPQTKHAALRPDWVFSSPVSVTGGGVAGAWKHTAGNAYRGAVSFAAL